MSVVLNREHKSELPLIAFTTCVPAAEGVALCSLFLGGGLPLAVACWVLATVGMVASIAHLARPLRAPRALTNLKSSWLSREILAVGAFWGLLAIWTLGAIIGFDPLAAIANEISAIVGVPLLWIIARAYRVSTRPAWCGPEGLAELWACALGAGTTLSLACVTCPWFGLAESALSRGEFPFVTCGLIAATIGGLGIDLWSHMARRDRLESLRSESDERIPLTLKHYAQLWPQVRKLWLAEAVCLIALFAIAILIAKGLLTAAFALAALASIGQIAIHGLHRNLFYELPVQVRWVAALRK